MGTQDGLTRCLKVRGKSRECENLSVGELLASTARLRSCWCDFPAGRGRSEQGHAPQMVRHPFGCNLAGDGGHGPGGSRWPQSRSPLLPRLSALAEVAFVQGSKGSPDLQQPGRFSTIPPLTIKIQEQSQITSVIYCYQPTYIVG